MSRARARRKREAEKKQVSKHLRNFHYYVMWQAQRGICAYCEKKMHHRKPSVHHDDEATVDHIIPLSKGGSNMPDNVVLACRACNQAKGDKSKEQFMRELRERKAGNGGRVDAGKTSDDKKMA